MVEVDKGTEGGIQLVKLAVETAPTSLCTPVVAVLTAKLLIQTTTGQRLLPGRFGAPQTLESSRSRPLLQGGALPVGAVLTAKLLIHTHDWAAAITGTVWGASDTEELAVETAPTSLCTPVGAVLTAKLLIQTTTGHWLLPGLSGAPRTP